MRRVAWLSGGALLCPRRFFPPSNLFSRLYCQLAPHWKRRQVIPLSLFCLVSLSFPSLSYAQREDTDYYIENVQQAINELQVLLSLVEKNRLEDFRLQLRSPPFHLLRKSCTQIYLKRTRKGSERRKQAESIYRQMLGDLEKADFLALQLERNSQKESQNKQVLIDSVESTMRHLQQFVQLIE
ncbi:hypothetical protein GpartN1_g7503.t1 [Galdieria partita]|uniref:Uncharacterized protein n=1 Tax=Galdieria partita TaxID=83374 RepID=A0A9C7UUR6_9RHOD|nr:hypothetical protein GpartN1_g7503.t1 [Galdieria partita]